MHLRFKTEAEEDAPCERQNLFRQGRMEKYQAPQAILE
jgi:hypothetical protein